jgi:rod shape-determining protein MreD
MGRIPRHAHLRERAPEDSPVKLHALFAVAGLAALVVQGVLATLIAPPWCPDLALLVLIAVGLRWEGAASGVLLAALLGFATDLLSGSLLGQHALLDLFIFTGTLLASRQLNLRGVFPLACFAAGISFLYGAAMLAITGFFVGGAELGWSWLSGQLIHALVAGLVAPFISALVGRLFDRFTEQDAGNRLVPVGGAG